MVWLALDPGPGQEVMLTMPRVQPVDLASLDAWTSEVRQAARLNHPHIAPTLEIGVQDHWPFLAVDRALGVTLGEWLADHPPPSPLESVTWACQALAGLAFAHEASVAHRDLQLHNVLVSEQGVVRIMALCSASDPQRDRAANTALPLGSQGSAMAMDPGQLRAQRTLAERDVLAFGVLLHRLLAGQSALDEADPARVIDRMPPLGREMVRLPWGTPQPVPEALRAISNRTTSSQERQRYLNARTLLKALDGWKEAEISDIGGPLALLLDRLRTVGHLPAMPGVGARVSRLLAADGQRIDEIAEQILQDMALSFEMLRQVNSAQYQGSQLAGSGPILTVRRAVALMGLNGVRNCSAGLRAWPGPLSEPAANALQRTVDRVRLAGYTAQLLRPAGYDSEVTYLVAVLQNLGRLLMQYHFPEEAEQIRQLMKPAPPPEGSPPGTREQPGLVESAASFAVLGIDCEELGAAVAKYWGLGEEMQHMMRCLPKDRPVRTPDGDTDLLRATASAANEAVDAISFLPAPKMGPALALIAQRYARVLNVEAQGLHEALKRARESLRSGTSVLSAGRDAVSEPPPGGTQFAEPDADPAANAVRRGSRLRRMAAADGKKI